SPYGPGGPGSVPNSNPYANPTVNQGQPLQLNPGSGGTAATTTTTTAPGSAPSRPTVALPPAPDSSSLFSTGSKAASYNAPVTPAGTIFAPLAVANNGGWNSILTVQNPSANAANYTITVWDTAGKAQATYSASTSPYGSTTFYLGTQLPAGIVGAVTVVCNMSEGAEVK